MSLSETELKFRLRLKTDFEFWAKNFCKIRTKAGEIKPLVLNRVQKKLLDEVEEQLRTTGKIRVIILKARQQGLSTFVSAYLYWRLTHRKARKGLVVAHTADAAKEIFGMYKRIHTDLPDQIRLKTAYSNRKELVFSTIDTGLMVGTAGGDGLGRGSTITDAHLSEVAFWPAAHARDNMNALAQAIPNTDDTAVFIESTADGISGPYYDLWQGAMRGDNGYVPFFSPWYDSDEYRFIDPPEPADGLWIEEEDLTRDLGLTWDQLAWRREKIAQNGTDKFKQEFPASAEEAFLTTGSPIFDPVKLNVAIGKTIAPEKVLDFVEGEWMECRFGKLSVWADPEKGETYYIGADVASGVGRDFSVAQVLDSEKRQVAVYRGKLDPLHFADALAALGTMYNDALLAVENNSWGYGVVTKLQHVIEYPNLYTEVKDADVREVHSTKLGFNTGTKSKPMMIGKLIQSIRQGEIVFNHETTIREMQTYVEVPSARGGVMQAAQGCHDDCVMSLALANLVHEGKLETVSWDLIEEYLIEANAHHG